MVAAGSAVLLVGAGAAFYVKSRPEPEPPSDAAPRNVHLDGRPGGPNQNPRVDDLRLEEALKQEEAARLQNASYATRMGALADFDPKEAQRAQQRVEVIPNQGKRDEKKEKPLPPHNKDAEGGIPDLSALMKRWDGEGTDTYRVDWDKIEKKRPAPQQANAGGAGGRSAPERQKDVIAPANTLAYGEVYIGGSSDNTQGPIAFEIFGGPLHGAKGTGMMSGARGNNHSDFQTVKVSALTLADGRRATTSGVLISPETMTAEVASHVDPHTMERVVYPMAAAFAQGIGQAAMFLGSSGFSGFGGGGFSYGGFNWTRAIGAGAGAAGGALGQVLRESTPRNKTIHVAARSEVGVLFTEPVVVEGNR